MIHGLLLAVTVTTMDLKDAVSYALGHSSTVAAQQAAVTQAQHVMALQAGTAYPTVDAMLQNILSKSANYQGSFAQAGISQQSVFSQNTAQVGINNWNLTTGGFAFLGLAATRAQVEQAKNTLANTEDQIASSVANGYYSIVQKQAVVGVDQITLSYQNVLVDVAKAKEKAGVAAGVDVLQAKTAQAKTQSALVADKAAVQDASEALAQQIGAPLTTGFVTPRELPQPPIPHGSIDSLLAIADANRPDVRSAHEAVIAANLTRKGWNVELFPSVDITAGIGNQYSPTAAGSIETQRELCLINKKVKDKSQCPYASTSGFWNLQMVSTFTFPLVDYNARHSERVNDDAQLASAKSTFEQTRLQAELDVRTSYRGAETALAQLTYAKQESDFGTESARIAQLQYKVGVKTIYDVLQAQQAAQQAVNDYVLAKVNYVDAVVKLRVSLGTFDARSAVADL